MNWKEMLVFPPEIPISQESRNLIHRYSILIRFTVETTPYWLCMYPVLLQE
jgi:hypothetical protein